MTTEYEYRLTPECEYDLMKEQNLDKAKPPQPQCFSSPPLPRSVYLHVPFCRHRCGYCNFSLVANRDYLIERYLGAIETEIGMVDRRLEMDTLFLGGGTPSHLPPKALTRLRAVIESRFDCRPDAEVTAECNPSDLTPEKSESLARFGVNRISLGVQSLNGEKLKFLERDHSRAEVERAIDQARSFAESVSLDLIFAVGDETLAEWEDDLEMALAFEPDHLSIYELTIEKGTRFWNRALHGELRSLDEELRADMYLMAKEMIEGAGLMQYEVSNFARPGHRSRHNEVYWNGLPYLAFGPGASRYVRGERSTNHASTMKYLKAIESGESPVAFSERLGPEASARELLAIGLRTIDGVDGGRFERMTGYRVAELLRDVEEDWVDDGLLVIESGRYRLTLQGLMVCDQIAVEIVS